MSFRLRIFVCLVGGLLLLQAADFALTWLLLDGRSDVYESNPLARSILDHSGWSGLAAFKIGVTAVALAAGLVLARRRLAAAVRLLAVLCLVMLGVNVYSGTLLAATDAGDEEERQVLLDQIALKGRVRATREFAQLREELCDRLLAGRVGRDEATRLLTESIRQFAPRLRLPPAARLPDPSRGDEVTAYLAFHLRSRATQRGLDTAAAGDLVVHRPLGEANPDEPLAPAWLRVSQ